jgi:hypothetical protein
MATACTSNISWSMYPATGSENIYQISLLFVHWMQLASSLDATQIHSIVPAFMYPSAYPSG